VLGYCPFCRRDLAPSADACPNCGNREFTFDTGEILTAVLRDAGACDVCGATGTITYSGMQKCPRCKGTGRGFWSDCKECHGSTWVSTTGHEKCTRCSGAGAVEEIRETVRETIDTRSGKLGWSGAATTLDSIDPDWQDRLPRPERSTGRYHLVGEACPGCKGSGKVRIATDKGFPETSCGRCNGRGEIRWSEYEYQDTRTGNRFWHRMHEVGFY
jgi:DnaJ-class molecular chaperone